MVSSHGNDGEKDLESQDSKTAKVAAFEVDGSSSPNENQNSIFDSRTSIDEASNSLNPVLRNNVNNTNNNSSSSNNNNNSSRSSSNKAERRQQQTPDNYIECSNCECKRPRNAHHCHECKLCIVDLDHHCPWTGKCIGKKNLTFFHNFLISLSSLICFVIIAVIYAASQGFSIVGDA